MSFQSTITAPSEIETLFSTTNHWWLLAEGLSCQVSLSSTTAVYHYVPAVSLPELHPRLWPTLNVLVHTFALRIGLAATTMGLNGNTLRGQLALLRAPERMLDVDDTHHHVARLTNIQWARPAKKVLLAYVGSTVQTVRPYAHYPTTDCVESSDVRLKQVPVLWMDQHNPGWRERYQVGVDLGYTGVELADLVQTPALLTPGVNAALPSTDLTCG